MSRKRSKALDANHTDRLSGKHAAADAISLDEGHGLAAVAAQLAALEDTFSLMDRATIGARDRCCELGDWKTATPEQVAASKARTQFDDVLNRTHDLTDTLQDLILQMEPRTLDETLSLSLVYSGQMSIFLSEIAGRPESVSEDKTKVRSDMLERAMQAIIRGLIHSGAVSPLLEHYACRDGLIPMGQLRREVSRTAAQYDDQSANAGKGGAS